MGRTRTKTNANTMRAIGIRLEPALYEWVTARAKETGTSASGYCRLLVQLARKAYEQTQEAANEKE